MEVSSNAATSVAPEDTTAGSSESSASKAPSRCLPKQLPQRAPLPADVQGMQDEGGSKSNTTGNGFGDDTSSVQPNGSSVDAENDADGV
eukprot:5000478-Pleurochrysis_carterae.AAC.1